MPISFAQTQSERSPWLRWALLGFLLVICIDHASGAASLEALLANAKENQLPGMQGPDPQWTGNMEESYRLRQDQAVQLRIVGSGSREGSLGTMQMATALLARARQGQENVGELANQMLAKPFRDSWDSYSLRSVMLMRVLLQFGDLVHEPARKNMEAYIRAYFTGERNAYYKQYNGSPISMYPMFLKTLNRPHLIEQTYPHNFSENHYLKFAVCNYFTGVLFGDESYPNGPWARKGSEQKEYWREDLLLYLDLIARYGFQERDSLGYYLFDIHALTLLYDFAPDAMVKKKAGMILDQLVADIARKSQQGVMGGPNMRSFAVYGHVFEQNQSPIYRAAWLLFGDAPEPTSVYDDNDFGSLEFSSYRPPSVLSHVVTQKLMVGTSSTERKRPDIVSGDDMHTASRLYSYAGESYMMGAYQQIDNFHRSQYQSVPWRLDIIDPSYKGVVLGIAGTPSQGIYSGGNLSNGYKPAGDGKYRFPMWSVLVNQETGLLTDATFFQQRNVLLSQYQSYFRTSHGKDVPTPTVVYIPANLDRLDVDSRQALFGQLGSVYFGLRTAYGGMSWLARTYSGAEMGTQTDGFRLVTGEGETFWESNSDSAKLVITVDGFGAYALAFKLSARAQAGANLRITWAAKSAPQATPVLSGTQEVRLWDSWSTTRFGQALLDDVTLLPVKQAASLAWTITLETDGPGVDVKGLTATADPAYLQQSYLQYGDLLICDEWSEVVALEVGEAKEYPGLAAFKKALLERPLHVEAPSSLVAYNTADAGTIGFRWRNDGAPLLNGQPVDLDTEYQLYHNAYMEAEWGSGLIAFADRDYALVLDHSGKEPQRYWVLR